MSTKFLSPGWRMPRNANQSKQSNYSMDFDGNSQYVSISNSTALSSYSISCWVNADTLSNFTRLVSLDSTNHRFLGLHGDGTLISGYNSGGWSELFTTSTINTGTWNHIVLVDNGTNTKIYVNTVENTLSNSIAVDGPNYYIGSYQGTGNFFNGQIDAVAIFDYALSSSQITTLYGTGSAIGNPMALPSPPIAYYPLGTSAWNGQYLAENNAIGDYVFDFIPNGYINIHDSSSLRVQNLTISLWVNAGTQSNNYRYFLEKGNLSYVVYTGGTTTDLLFQEIYDGSSYYFSNALTNTLDNNWHHIAFTYDGSQIIGYKDGVANTPVSASGTILHDTNPLRIGSRAPSLGNYPSGKMSNVQIFNTALSATDVETLYNYGSPIRTLANIPQSSNLKAWYKLDASEIYNSTSTEWEINNALSSYNNSLFVDNAFQSTSTNGITMGSYSDTAGLSAVSWSLWVNLKTLNSASGYSRILNSDSFSFATNASNGGLNWRSAFVTVNGTINNDFTFSTALQNQGWVNIIGTYDGTNTKFYLNTVQQGTQGTGSGVLNTTSSLNLGYFYGSNSVDAYFSNFSIWNKALSTSDISEIYNSGSPTDLSSHSSTSNLINWWKLNNLSSGLQDSKGSSNATTTGTSGSTTIQPGSVSTLNGLSSGMNQSNLVQSDLQTVAPYSKYAIEFDHADADYIDLTSDINLGSTMSFSVWLKTDHVNDPSDPQNVRTKNITGGDGFFNFNELFGLGLTNGRLSNYVANTSGSTGFALSTNPLNDNIWHHCFVTFDGSTLKSYIDGSLNVTIEGITTWTSNIIKTVGKYDSAAIRYFDGILSNMAVWNSALTDSQAREVYNEGLPSDLNTFSGPAPVAWWQLGENSSYAGGWIFANEIGSINGEGQNLTEINLVNGVGTTANGTSTGMSEGNLVGDAPYSTGNAISSGMAVTAKGTDVP